MLVVYTNYQIFISRSLLPDKKSDNKRKTKVVKNEINPVWDERFIFEHIAKIDLPSLGVELVILNNNNLKGSDFLGACMLNAGSRELFLINLIRTRVLYYAEENRLMAMGFWFANLCIQLALSSFHNL